MQSFSSLSWQGQRFGLTRIMKKKQFELIVLVAIMVYIDTYHYCFAADCSKMPPRINPSTCCPIPELITDENNEKCKEFLMHPSPSPTFVPMSNENPPTAKGVKSTPTPAVQKHAPSMHLCYLSCVFNDTGLLVDDKINEPNLSLLLKKVLKDTPEFIPELEKSFKTCSNRTEKFHRKMQEKLKNRTMKEPNNHMYQPLPLPCSPKINHIMACVYTETFTNCPAKYWSKSNACSELRDHMKNCSFKFGNSMEDSNIHSSEEVKLVY